MAVCESLDFSHFLLSWISASVSSTQGMSETVPILTVCERWFMFVCKFHCVMINSTIGQSSIVTNKCLVNSYCFCQVPMFCCTVLRFSLDNNDNINNMAILSCEGK